MGGRLCAAARRVAAGRSAVDPRPLRLCSGHVRGRCASRGLVRQREDDGRPLAVRARVRRSRAAGPMSAPPQPPQIETAGQLLLKQLSKLITIEETLVRAVLPKLKQEAQDEQLEQAFADHLEQTKQHVQNVRAAFGELGASPKGGEDKVLDAAKKEREHQVQRLAPALRDGFNASTAMGTE